MNKIKKLGIVVIALAMCLLLGVTAWAVDADEVMITAIANQEVFCQTGEPQKVTVTIAVNQEIELISLDAIVTAPEGWEVEIDNLELTEAGLSYGNRHILWFHEDSLGDFTADQLINIIVTIPADVELGTYKIGLNTMEVAKVEFNGDSYKDVILVSDAIVTTQISVIDHDFSKPSYTDNEDGTTHTVTRVCVNDNNHVETYSEKHIYAEGKCECGAEEIAAPAGLKGDIDLDGEVGTLADLTMLARHVMDYEYITDDMSLLNGDIDGDGDVDLTDLTRLARFNMGYDDTLE